jgi:hypothetical protein
MKFMFDAQRLRKEETPADHEMEDGDVVGAPLAAAQPAAGIFTPCVLHLLAD